MANILVIGGTGFLGINLALGLNSRGHRIAVTGTRPLPPEILAALPDLKVFPVRLSNHGAIEEILSSYLPDVVVHMASTLTPASSNAQFMIEREEVINPTIHLLNILAVKQIPIIFVSSGGTIYGSSSKDRLSEEDSCCPINLYGLTKLEIENYTRFAYRALGLQYLILRPSNPYGLYQSLDSGQGLISVIFGKLQRGESLEIWGDGSAVRDYIHVDDFVNAVCDILQRDIWNRTINIGSGAGHSLLEVVRATEAATGRQVAMTFKPSRGVDVNRIVLDVTRLIELNAWHHRSLATGIHSYAKQLGLIDGK